MKTIAVFLLIVVILSPRLVGAQETSEANTYEVGIYHQSLFDGGDITPRLLLDGYVYLTERSGVWGFAYGEKQYVSSVVGLFYDLFQFGQDSVFELGLAVGAETYPSEFGSYHFHPRVAGMIYVGNENLSTSLYYEDWSGSESESWLRAEANWQATERFAFGLIHQTGDGTGPRVRYSIPNSPVRLWLAPMWGEGDRKVLLGLEAVFSN